MNRIKVTWLPEHPVIGSMSMQRYWKLLESASRPDDPFDCSSIFPPDDDKPVKRGGKLIRYLARKVIYPTKIKLHAKGDIIHVLDHSWADLLQFTPKEALKVVTVHDLIPLRFPGELTPAQAQRFRGWVAHLSMADAIIADSAYTKQEVQELLGIEAKKIHVVLLGAEVPNLASAGLQVPKHRDADQHFQIGSIGSTLERKNLAILPEALARLQAAVQRKVVLMRVGAALPGPLAAALRNALGEDGLVELGRLPDESLGEYYAGLDAVVIPSLYEGFGLPVIEAMAARVPVVASRATSLPEVGGDTAYYFDPHSPEELAAVLAGIANDGVPQRRIEEGYERAKSLSWRKCLEGVYEVYAGLLEERAGKIARSQ
jgi:glycosyltransferase involved in cell wall biosynthesis